MNVYSTVAGELPLMVRNGTPVCFVPYSQALEMVAEITRLKAELTSLQTTRDMWYKMGACVGAGKVDQIREDAEKLQKSVEVLLEFATRVGARV